MPSRWREAHVLDRLEKEHDHLEEIGRTEDALHVQEIIDELEEEARLREETARKCALLTHWDTNDDGQWDEEELAAHREELARVTKEVGRIPHQKRWFLQLHGQLFGPVRWSEIPSLQDDVPLLVSLDGESGWLALRDLATG